MATAQFTHPAFEDFAEFLAKLSPQKVLSFKASRQEQTRLNFLLKKNKTEGLTKDEQQEVEHFMEIEHLVRMAKIRAIKQLNVD